MLLKDQVVVVTGAGAGMGRAYAEGVVQEGGRVVALEVDEGTLQSLARELGDACIPIAGDIGSDGAAAIAEAIKRAGKVDAVINNAGVFRREPFVTHSVEAFDRIMHVNVRGPFLTCQAAVQHWTETQRAGRIVNISSRGGIWCNNPGMVAYAASKAGIVGLTMSLAEELSASGISVNAVCPAARTAMAGLTPAELAAQADVEARHPRQMVGPVLYLASSLASWISGQVFVVDDGRLQWLHGWHAVSGIKKDSRWEPGEMDAAFKRLLGVMTQMSDDRRNRYASIAGIAALGRADWQRSTS